MDPTRFDRLSRALAAHGPRRGLLALLAALPVAGALLSGGRLPLVVTARGAHPQLKKDKGKGNDQHKGKGKEKAKKGKGNGNGKDQQRTTAQAEVCWRAGACSPKKGSNVSQCNLAGYTAPASLDCTRCNISRANLRAANLSGANLTAANLSGACLVDANLTDAIIANNTNLYGAIFCRTIVPDGSVNNSGCSSGTPCCPTCDAGQPCASGCCNTAAGACGACPSGSTCGGGNPGAPGICGCTSSTCPTGANCGTIPNVCGGTVSCGSCPFPGQPCTNNVCGTCVPSCTGKACGAANDCGGICTACSPTCLTGSCPSGQGCRVGTCAVTGRTYNCSCGDGTVRSACGPASCSGPPIIEFCASLCANNGGYNGVTCLGDTGSCFV